MDIRQELDALREESPIKYNFVIERSTAQTNAAALAKIERTQSWLHMLDDKDYLVDLASRLHADRVYQAEVMLRQATIKAASVMIEDLQSKDRKLRQAAAKDILDRVGVRAPDKTQVEVIATIAARTLEDVLMQVYGQPEQLPAGDIVEGEIVDNVDDN
jgi:hypothetical protein